LVLDPQESGLPFPIYSLVGGKWTSFRVFSEQVTDKVLAFLGRPRQSDTRGRPIGGAVDYPATPADRKRFVDGTAARFGLDVAHANDLFDRYGTRCTQCAEFIGQGKDQPLRSLPGYSAREIGFIARRERVVHLDDFLLRRSMIAMLGHLSEPALREIADALGDHLGWDSARRGSEIGRTSRMMFEQHGVRL
jgi:glycerol-3-phosphate dehydrogenase